MLPCPSPNPHALSPSLLASLSRCTSPSKSSLSHLSPPSRTLALLPPSVLAFQFSIHLPPRLSHAMDPSIYSKTPLPFAPPPSPPSRCFHRVGVRFASITCPLKFQGQHPGRGTLRLSSPIATGRERRAERNTGEPLRLPPTSRIHPPRLRPEKA